jgi:hypothetical protein
MFASDITSIMFIFWFSAEDDEPRVNFRDASSDATSARDAMAF